MPINCHSDRRAATCVAIVATARKNRACCCRHYRSNRGWMHTLTVDERCELTSVYTKKRYERFSCPTWLLKVMVTCPSSRRMPVPRPRAKERTAGCKNKQVSCHVHLRRWVTTQTCV